MNSLILVILAIIGYLLAYRFYGRFLGRKIFQLSAGRRMPAHEFRDGVDFVPAKPTIIFGHHFTTIAGLGPIVGPAIGVIWGWLPAFLWVFLGSIFMGAVHDFSTLVVSARNRGRSIGELTADIISPATRYALQFIMQLLLFIVLAVFAMIVGSLFVSYPEAVIPVWAQIPVAVWLGWKIRQDKNELMWSIVALLMLYAFVLLGVRFPVSLPWSNEVSVVVWCIILFVYVFFASTIPVQKLLQPRDYINSHQLMVAMAFLIIGIFVAHPVFSAPAINESAFLPGSDVPDLAPVLFIVIACGAISGFHSLASSGTTVKQVDNEMDTLPIGYGAMLTESFLAVLVIVAAGAGLGMGLETEGGLLQGADAYRHHYASWSSASGLSAKLDAFIIGSANLFSSLGVPVKYGAAFVVVFIVSFANTTLDSAARIQRISLQEIFTRPNGKINKPLDNRYIATAFVVLAAAAMAFFKPGGQGAMVLWPLFGSLNQLMAALALGVVTVYLAARKIPVWYTMLPMLVILILTLWAMVENLAGFMEDREWLLVVLSAIILGLTAWLTISSLVALLRRMAARISK
ncbi:MAG: carbon starvation protein A [Bacteroidota bacterium]|nr:carbon starvation protein A [Bacteroidota bacterium]